MASENESRQKLSIAYLLNEQIIHPLKQPQRRRKGRPRYMLEERHFLFYHRLLKKKPLLEWEDIRLKYHS